MSGGDPMFQPEACNEIAKYVKEKGLNLWVYTGFTWEELTADQHIIEGLQNVDVLVDGRYDDSLKDLSLPFRGSTNQRIIDVQQSLKSGEPVLWSLQY